MAGLGIAILRDDVVAAELAAGRLVPALDAYNPLTVPVFAVYPERAWLRAAVTAFIEHVTAGLTDAQPQAATRVAVTRKMP